MCSICEYNMYFLISVKNFLHMYLNVNFSELEPIFCILVRFFILSCRNHNAGEVYFDYSTFINLNIFGIIIIIYLTFFLWNMIFQGHCRMLRVMLIWKWLVSVTSLRFTLAFFIDTMCFTYCLYFSMLLYFLFYACYLNSTCNII